MRSTLRFLEREQSKNLLKIHIRTLHEIRHSVGNLVLWCQTIQMIVSFDRYMNRGSLSSFLHVVCPYRPSAPQAKRSHIRNQNPVFVENRAARSQGRAPAKRDPGGVTRHMHARFSQQADRTYQKISLPKSLVNNLKKKQNKKQKQNKNSNPMRPIGCSLCFEKKTKAPSTAINLLQYSSAAAIEFISRLPMYFTLIFYLFKKTKQNKKQKTKQEHKPSRTIHKLKKKCRMWDWNSSHDCARGFNISRWHSKHKAHFISVFATMSSSMTTTTTQCFAPMTSRHRTTHQSSAHTTFEQERAIVEYCNARKQ